jgi:arginase
MPSAHPNSRSSSRRFAVIEAPSPLGLRPPRPGQVPGTRRMPQVLREAGLWRDVRTVSHVTLAEPAYAPEPDASSGIRNLNAIERFSRTTADAIAQALDAGHTPVVIGGDCSVMIGAALALAPRGRHRLIYLDGHNDFAYEGNMGRPYPNIAGAALAVLTGRGPKALTEIGGAGATPLLHEEDVLHVGLKAEPGTPDWLDDFARTGITHLPLAAIRSHGLAQVVDAMQRWLDAPPAPAFWLHVDVDVLDPAVMPAVDSPDPGGFDWDEFEAVLGSMLAHPRLLGTNVGIYDPDLDPDRQHARRLVEVLHRCLDKALAPKPAAAARM